MKKIMYWLSKVFYITCSFLFVFIFLFSILSFFEFYLGWDIPFVEIIKSESKTMIHIIVPVVKMRLIFPPSIIVMLPLITFSFYAFYFYHLHLFFGMFIKPKLFTSDHLKKMKLFYRLNLVIVVISAVATLFNWVKDREIKMDETFLIVGTHCFVAVIIHLYLEMAKKGNQLQQENDFTI
jgi:hypothetical protein